jgi:hypothetical protein
VAILDEMVIGGALVTVERVRVVKYAAGRPKAAKGRRAKLDLSLLRSASVAAPTPCEISCAEPCHSACRRLDQRTLLEAAMIAFTFSGAKNSAGEIVPA